MKTTCTHNMDVIEHEIDEYEKVLEFIDSDHGLRAFIAIHNTRLGVALGGTRFFHYDSADKALTDVLRLAKGMSYKSALAEVGTGGGKSVIMADKNHTKTPDLLRAFARAVNLLQGEYICAEDVGITASDLTVMREGTQYIVGIPHLKSSGNPSPFTAFGVFMGLLAASFKKWNTRSLKGKKVAIQGVGSVGRILAEYLFFAGADLIISDINQELCREIAHRMGATIVSPQEILTVECDIFSPCAMGGILNSKTIPNFKCEIVAGAANNQLLSSEDGALLQQMGILYAPDFVINAGGLINVCCEIEPEGYSATLARERIELIYERVMEIFDRSEQQGCSTNDVAIQIGDERLKKKIGKRTIPPVFHH